MPLEQISRLFDGLYGYDLNSTTILDALERGYERTARLEEATYEPEFWITKRPKERRENNLVAV